MKVLYYNHSADVSGAEISLLLTIANMQGIRTLLVAPAGDLLHRAAQLGLQFIPVRGFRARMSRNPVVLLQGILGTWRAGIELRHIVIEQLPDIVHANSIRAGLIAIIAASGTKSRLFWHVRDNLPNSLMGWVIRLLARWFVDRVIVISHAVRDEFATVPGLKQKTSVIHNGVDIHQPTGLSIRSAIGTPSAAFVTAVVGQITPWKRQLDAIAAFARFAEHAHDCELWIVGEPKFRPENVDYERRLRLAVQQLRLTDRVRFLGYRQDVMNVMASIDALLLPSDGEPFGRVLIEAMLSGKCVIGTKSGGVPEIVIENETGYLVGVGDIEAMAEKLLRLHANPELCQVVGSRARERVKQCFSITAVSDRLNEYYLEYRDKPVRARLSL